MLLNHEHFMFYYRTILTVTVKWSLCRSSQTEKSYVCVSYKRDLSFVILKGTFHLSFQRDLSFIIPKRTCHLSYQNGAIICHTNMDLPFVMLTGTCHLSYQKGPVICLSY